MACMRCKLAVLGSLALALPAPAQEPCGIRGVFVTVSPEVAAPGEVVEITLTNNSDKPISLPNSSTYEGVFSGSACTGTSVFNPISLTMILEIPPGESIMRSWDQMDDSGRQVPDGTYSFDVRYLSTNSLVLACCPEVTIARDADGKSPWAMAIMAGILVVVAARLIGRRWVAKPASGLSA